jgi:hypothetical protein
MSHSGQSSMRNRIEVEFVEADVEMGFNLVDMAEAECGRGNALLATRVIEDAEDIFADIQQRLQRLDTGNQNCFGPLVDELRRQIDVARSHNLPQA